MTNRVSLLLVAIATLASPAAAQNGDPLAARVDSMFAEYDRPGFPGAAVAVVKDGRIVLERGYGLANLEHSVRITPTTVFDIASVSKQFAGLAIAMLVDQGRINLKDDVRKYIPELQDFGHTITIDHLLHHTSGIRDWPATLSIAGWRFDDVISFDQILRFAYNQRTLNFTPGAEYTYSNTGYNLLAEVVKRVTGKSFRSWTDENLFRPLGMTSTHFHDDHAMVVRNRAYGYARTDSGFRAVTNNLTALGSSSLYSTVGDLARWVLNFEEPKVGGRKAMELTRTRGVLNDGSQIPYAFGVSHADYRGLPTVNHSGGWAAFNTFLLHFPNQRMGVIVLANSGVIPSARVAYGIADLYLEGALGPRPSAPSMATAPVAEVPEAILDRYVGLYRLGPAWYVRIRRDGRTLRSLATREVEVALSPRTESSFWVPAYAAVMAFERDSATKAVTMLYRGRRIPRMASPEPRTRALSELAGEYESDELQARYTVDVKDTTVTLRHRRHGTITLTRAWGDDYVGSAGFNSVEFQRDPSGRVTGFVVNAGDRVRNVQFLKRR